MCVYPYTAIVPKLNQAQPAVGDSSRWVSSYKKKIIITGIIIIFFF